MTTENQHQQQPSTFQYGDAVLYRQNGKIIHALVMQSQIVPVPDRSVSGGLRNEEHLVLRYLIPAAGKPVMSQIDMDEAIGKAFGVVEASETNRTGWIRCTVTADEGASPGTELRENQSEYAGQHTG